MTVLRANERAAFSWREPFSGQIGASKKSGDFELTLAKAELLPDTLQVEWTCHMPAAAAVEDDLWKKRQLKSTLIYSDKTTQESEVGADTPSLVRRLFKLNKKFPVALEVTFISDLKCENVLFTLSNITLEGPAQKKPDEHGKGQTF